LRATSGDDDEIAVGTDDVAENRTPVRAPGFLRETLLLLDADATTAERRRHERRNATNQRRFLQLSVLAQHGAAFIADAPAMSGKRRAAAQQIGPSHATRTIAHPCCSRLAWRELGKVNRLRGSSGKRDQRPDQQACEYHWLHPQSSLAVFGKDFA
jgi:hypothetical protein